MGNQEDTDLCANTGGETMTSAMTSASVRGMPSSNSIQVMLRCHYVGKG